MIGCAKLLLAIGFVLVAADEHTHTVSVAGRAGCARFPHGDKIDTNILYTIDSDSSGCINVCEGFSIEVNRRAAWK